MKKIYVKEWNKALGVTFLYLEAQAISDSATTEGPGHHSLEDFDGRVVLHVPARRRGQVVIHLKIDYLTPRNKKTDLLPVQLTLAFRCNDKGDVILAQPPPHRLNYNWFDYPLSVALEVHIEKEHPSDPHPAGMPPSVWSDWMKQLSILHIVLVVNLTMGDDGDKGSLSYRVMDKSVADSISKGTFVAGATGPRTAQLGPMRIALGPVGVAPPITSPGGQLYPVYFGVDSSDINKTVKDPTGTRDQGKALDDWIGYIMSLWDVKQALGLGLLPLKGEARASATYEGKSEREIRSDARLLAACRSYNQKKSEERRDAVKRRLQTTIHKLDLLHLADNMIRIEAVGMDKAAKLGEEDVRERVCVISIDQADLKKAIQEFYERKPRFKSIP